MADKNFWMSRRGVVVTASIRSALWLVIVGLLLWIVLRRMLPAAEPQADSRPVTGREVILSERAFVDVRSDSLMLLASRAGFQIVDADRRDVRLSLKGSPQALQGPGNSLEELQYVARTWPQQGFGISDLPDGSIRFDMAVAHEDTLSYARCPVALLMSFILKQQ